MQINFSYLVDLLAKRRQWIILPTLLFTVAAVGYALFKQDYWVAQQALIVRNESVGQISPLGQFESVDSMQTAQETIYEVAHHTSVLRKALKDVGPYKRIWSKRRRAAWPPAEVVDDFRKTVSVDAPMGAEFGRTELIYVTVKAETPKRAKALTEALAKRLSEHLKLLREQKYQGIVEELTRSSALAQTELHKAMLKLQKLDRDMGSDLVELRVMNNSSMGEGTLGRTLGELRTELRQAETADAQLREERTQLWALQDNQTKLESFPNTMLDSQPTLKRLKEKLVDARVKTANLSGEMSAEHPSVRAAVLAEAAIRDQLYQALRTAIGTIDSHLAASANKVKSLAGQLRNYERRYGDLSNLRTTYNRLVQEVETREKFLQTVEEDLATAKANVLAASASSTLQMMEAPVVSTHPIGPSGKLICFAGLMAGVFTGLGAIWLMEPIVPPGHSGDPQRSQSTNKNASVERRRKDSIGRRKTDWIRSVWPEGIPRGDAASAKSRHAENRIRSQVKKPAGER